MNKRNWLLVSGLALAMALVQGCGSVQEGDSTDDTPDSYVRLPIAVVTEEFTERTGFNRDEVQDDEYVFGYLPFATTTRLRPEENAKLVVLESICTALTIKSSICVRQK